MRQGPSPYVADPSIAGPVAVSSAAAGPSTGSVATGPSAVAAGAGPSMSAARSTATPVAPIPAAGDAEGCSSVAPAQRRYHTRVGLTPPAPSHPRPAQRALSAKRAWISGPGESSTSISREPPSPPYQGIAGAPYLCPRSIIRRPYFPCDPNSGNVSCRDRDFHGEVYYDLPAFFADPGLRDSLLLIQRYHLEPFMVPHLQRPKNTLEFL